MSLSSHYKQDEKKVVDGVRVEMPANEDKTIPTFTVGRATQANKSYSKTLEKTFRPHQRALKLKTLDNDRAGDLLMDVFISTLLRGWENVLKSDVTGNPEDTGFSEFNATNAKALFKRLPDLYDELNNASNEASLFLDGTLEETSGN